MSAIPQFSIEQPTPVSRLSQPLVPVNAQVPPTRSKPQDWTAKQPRELKKPPRSVGSLEGWWQTVKEEVPTDYATKRLDEIYVLEHRPSVARFIEKNRLRGMLLQASQPLSEAFGDKAVKILSLMQDDEGFETLFCLVATPGDMQQARRA